MNQHSNSRAWGGRRGVRDPARRCQACRVVAVVVVVAAKSSQLRRPGDRGMARSIVGFFSLHHIHFIRVLKTPVRDTGRAPLTPGNPLYASLDTRTESYYISLRSTGQAVFPLRQRMCGRCIGLLSPWRELHGTVEPRVWSRRDPRIEAMHSSFSLAVEREEQQRALTTCGSNQPQKSKPATIGKCKVIWGSPLPNGRGSEEETFDPRSSSMPRSPCR